MPCMPRAQVAEDFVQMNAGQHTLLQLSYLLRFFSITLGSELLVRVSDPRYSLVQSRPVVNGPWPTLDTAST